MLAEHRQKLQDIPEDFISEMKEAFKLFDKVKLKKLLLLAEKSVVHYETPQNSTGLLGSKEIPQLLRTLGYNPTETEVVFPLNAFVVTFNAWGGIISGLLVSHCR